MDAYIGASFVGVQDNIRANTTSLGIVTEGERMFGNRMIWGLIWGTRDTDEAMYVRPRLTPLAG